VSWKNLTRVFEVWRKKGQRKGARPTVPSSTGGGGNRCWRLEKIRSFKEKGDEEEKKERERRTDGCNVLNRGGQGGRNWGRDPYRGPGHSQGPFGDKKKARGWFFGVTQKTCTKGRRISVATKRIPKSQARLDGGCRGKDQHASLEPNPCTNYKKPKIRFSQATT